MPYADPERRRAAAREQSRRRRAKDARDISDSIESARKVFLRAGENGGAIGPDDARVLEVVFSSLVEELEAADAMFQAFGDDGARDGARVLTPSSVVWEVGFVLAMQRALGELGPDLAKGLLSVPEARASLRAACANAGDLAETLATEHALSLAAAKKGT